MNSLFITVIIFALQIRRQLASIASLTEVKEIKIRIKRKGRNFDGAIDLFKLPKKQIYV